LDNLSEIITDQPDGSTGSELPGNSDLWRMWGHVGTCPSRTFPALPLIVKGQCTHTPTHQEQYLTMPPVPPSSSAILSILSEAKEFLLQHYILVIVGVVVARLVYLRYLHPYRDIPGPFLATISPLWRLRGALNGTLHTDITAAHRKYGKIFRIAPDEVSISDPEAIKTIYAHGAGFIKVDHSERRIYQ
jgi:hypothetical protein